MNNQFKDRFPFIAGVVIILRKNDKVLLMRRCNTGWMDGYYGFAGGGIDGGETIMQVGAREAQEELGVQIVPEALRLVHVMHGRHPDGCEGFSFFVEAAEWVGTPRIMEPEKCDDLVWVRFADLPEKVLSQVGQALECIEKKVMYSGFGWEK